MDLLLNRKQQKKQTGKSIFIINSPLDFEFASAKGLYISWKELPFFDGFVCITNGSRKPLPTGNRSWRIFADSFPQMNNYFCFVNVRHTAIRVSVFLVFSGSPLREVCFFMSATFFSLAAINWLQIIRHATIVAPPRSVIRLPPAPASMPTAWQTTADLILPATTAT